MNYDNINSAYLCAQLNEVESKAQAISKELERNCNLAIQRTADASQAQQELLAIQLEQLKQQNKLLMSNYKKLEELYEVQSQNYKQSSEELKASKKYNRVMLWVSISSVIVAVVSTVVSTLVSLL